MGVGWAGREERERERDMENAAENVLVQISETRTKQQRVLWVALKAADSHQDFVSVTCTAILLLKDANKAWK